MVLVFVFQREDEILAKPISVYVIAAKIFDDFSLHCHNRQCPLLTV